MKFLISVILVAVILSFYHCSKSNNVVYKHFGSISYPADNLPDERKIALGKALFFDVRLSKDNSISCASCHKPEFAFADTMAVSPGIGGLKGFRNAPSLFNVAFYDKFMLDGAVDNLEMQAIVPIQDHNEMNMRMEDLIKKLRGISEYQQAAKQIFDRDLDAFVLTRSIAAYERTLISSDSRFDRFFYHGEPDALSDSEKRGWILFDKKFTCTQCHALPLFTNQQLRRNGLAVTEADYGLYRITGDSNDIGKFKVPSLRNVDLTAPYMHDGRFFTLDEVLTAYSKGKGHAGTDQHLQKNQINSKEKIDLINFLKSLTGSSIKGNTEGNI